MKCSLLALLIAILAGVPAVAAPAVVASIKPIHSLVAAVMEGVGAPALIVRGAASPHDYALRPSDAQKLETADLVFWIGPIFESFLTKPVAALAGRAEVVELDRAPGLVLLPARGGGAWEPEEHEGAKPASALEEDGHLWLDPENAKAIVRLAVARLSARDAAHAERYAANGAALEARLTALDAELRQHLASVRGKPFVVFHDAYQYLERRYGLDAIGSITVSPEHPPGARRIKAIRDKVARLGVRCVFGEPEFESLAQSTIAGTGAATAILDPEATTLPPGSSLYFALMRRLADGLVSCLDRPG